MPIISSSVFDDRAKPYDVSRILTPDYCFDHKAYSKYSKVYLPITCALSYAVQFASLLPWSPTPSAGMVVTSCNNHRDLLLTKAARTSQNISEWSRAAATVVMWVLKEAAGLVLKRQSQILSLACLVRMFTAV